MREALGTRRRRSDGYTSGWVWSYPLKAALEKAVANKDLTRAGLLKAAKSLTSVDYEGMLPAGAGNYAGGPERGRRTVELDLQARPGRADRRVGGEGHVRRADREGVHAGQALLREVVRFT